ncbi:MAG: DUF6328 family protein [Streptosporangiaceae bacterium]
MSTPDDRHETPDERDDRNLMELLQELRVAGLGVQVLFGFLLSLPFTNGFAKLSHAQRGLFMADLVLAALATILLVGPVAYHRLVFRHHLKNPLVNVANRSAIAGLFAVALAVVVAVILVTSFVEGQTPAIIVGIFIGCLFALLWFALPLIRRQRSERIR